MCGKDGGYSVCGIIPGVLVAGSLDISSEATVVDCQMERYHAVATGLVLLNIGGCTSRRCVRIAVPSKLVACGLDFCTRIAIVDS